MWQMQIPTAVIPSPNPLVSKLVLAQSLLHSFGGGVVLKLHISQHAFRINVSDTHP
jgi:hypothetical protein